jgi:vacuolar-type H+-ATPase subunit H
MSDKISPTTADAAAAIDEVLVAETAARQAMEACRKEAEEVLEAAREDARQINRIANQRITRLHARCNELVNSRIAGLRAEARESAVRTELNAADRDLLTRAVDRLAARLTRPGNG